MDRGHPRRARPLLECGPPLGWHRSKSRLAGRASRANRFRSASGDVGPDAKLLHPDPEAPAGLDYVISKSTYGDGDPRRPRPRQRAHLAREVHDAAAAKGAMLIPAFAVERTQELIVDLIDLMQRGEIPTAPVFLDSPLAIRATEVFRRNAASLDPTSI